MYEKVDPEITIAVAAKMLGISEELAQSMADAKVLPTGLRHIQYLKDNMKHQMRDAQKKKFPDEEYERLFTTSG